jgi:hypothetical protein
MHFTTETPLATKTTTQTYSISDAEIDAHRTFFPDENEHSIGEDSGELLSDDYDEEFEDKEDSPTTKSPPLLAFDLGSISRAELETMDELRPAAAQFTGERVEKSKDDTSMKHMNHHTNHRKTPSPTVAHSHHYTSITGRVLLSNGHNTRFHHKEKTTPTVATVATLSQLFVLYMFWKCFSFQYLEPIQQQSDVG